MRWRKSATRSGPSTALILPFAHTIGRGSPNRPAAVASLKARSSLAVRDRSERCVLPFCLCYRFSV
jgi:hypothetical protein